MASNCTGHEQRVGERSCDVLRLNPKALQESALFGKMDPNTNEWFDGIVSAVSPACFPVNCQRSVFRLQQRLFKAQGYRALPL